MSEFLDVFLEELLGVPPPREVEFTIDIAQNFEPIYRAPYKMASTKLKELKSQLEEILQVGLVRPSTSPWGTQLLFVNKDCSLRLYIDYKQFNQVMVEN